MISFSADNKSELWDLTSSSPYKLTDLGIGLEKWHFDLINELLTVKHIDGRAYVINLNWLKMMKGNPFKLSAEDLLNLSCYPFNQQNSLKDISLNRRLINPSICQKLKP